MSGAVWVAAGSAAAAAALAAPGTAVRAAGRGGARPAVPRVLAALLLGGAAVALSGVSGVHLALLLVAAAVVLAGSRLVAQARRARLAEQRRMQVTGYCEALLGELRAGQPVSTAVERAVRVWPETEPVAAAARLGADVPTALRRVALLPGARGVDRLAAAWELCAATGSGLAFAVEQVLQTARAEQAVTRLVSSELASARATAWLVAALPAVVLAAAHGIGARPWEFLFATVPGVVCLAGGAALGLTGLWWIDRIAAAAAEGEL